MTQAQTTTLTLVADTLMYSADGRLPALYLGAGDRVICATRGMVRLTDVTHSRAAVALIQVPRGALGPTQPEHPLILPADIPLPAGITARPAGTKDCALVTLHLPGYAVLLADGIKLATVAPDIRRAAA